MPAVKAKQFLMITDQSKFLPSPIPMSSAYKQKESQADTSSRNQLSLEGGCARPYRYAEELNHLRGPEKNCYSSPSKSDN